MTASIAIARQAKSKNIPVAIDGGSWKPDFDKVLPYVDYAICSDNFYPPDCSNQQDVFSYLQNMGIPYIAITQGDRPVRYLDRGQWGAIDIPAIAPIDTSGAGDVFHGSFCRYILDKSFTESLSLAAQIASHSCQFFGTRQWMGR
jgi:sugar/nucleoside kinase (ribokinase family)